QQINAARAGTDNGVTVNLMSARFDANSLPLPGHADLISAQSARRSRTQGNADDSCAAERIRIGVERAAAFNANACPGHGVESVVPDGVIAGAQTQSRVGCV